jgi:hypothetical protein
MREIKNFFIVCCVLITHFGVWALDQNIFSRGEDISLLTEELIIFGVIYVATFFLGICISIFIFPKIILVIISQLVYIGIFWVYILYNRYKYTHLPWYVDRRINFVELFIYGNILSIIVVLLIYLIYKLVKKNIVKFSNVLLNYLKNKK